MQSDDGSAALPSAFRSEQDLFDLLQRTKQWAAVNEDNANLRLENRELRRQQGLPDDRLVKLSMLVRSGSPPYQALRRAIRSGEVRGRREPLSLYLNSALAFYEYNESLGPLPPMLQKVKSEREKRKIAEIKQRYS